MGTKKSNAAAEREAAAKAKDSLPERDSYTAKQVATRCSTDAKTLRKFLRSNNSSFDAVGQGGRYEFDADQLKTIKAEFTAWRKKAEARRSSPAVVSTPIPKKPTPKAAPKITGLDPEGDIQAGIDKLHAEAQAKYKVDYDPDAEYDDDDEAEPTPEELAELDDLPEVDFPTHDPDDPHGIGGW